MLRLISILLLMLLATGVRADRADLPAQRRNSHPRPAVGHGRLHLGIRGTQEGRIGSLFAICKSHRDDRVVLGGRAVTVLRGELL